MSSAVEWLTDEKREQLSECRQGENLSLGGRGMLRPLRTQKAPQLWLVSPK